MSEFEQSTHEGDRGRRPAKTHFSIEIRDGDVHVAEPLPPGASLRIEVSLDAEPTRGDGAENELRARSRVARGSEPPPLTPGPRDAEALNQAAGAEAAGDDDDLDFEEKPTFDLDKSQLESLARGGTLPLAAPPAEPRVGNDIPPVSGTTGTADADERALPEAHEVVYTFEEDEHAGAVRQVLTRRDVSEPRRVEGFEAARATPPAQRLPAENAGWTTGAASDGERQRRERMIIVALTVALAAAVAAILALLLG